MAKNVNPDIPDNPSTTALWLKANEETLIRQSRSFAIPILNLDTRFKLPVMVEYNLNKTLDTIEDSTGLITDEKISLIEDFCEHLRRNDYSREVQGRMIEITPPEEVYVFKNYRATIHLFNTLSKQEQALMKKWSLEMARGMCTFLTKPIDTLNDLNEYCYYVAGTAGIFLTSILQLKGRNISGETYGRLKANAVPFGLFLQKLNIIRDYMEDRDIKKRSFWPRCYFEREQDPLQVLNTMCHETLNNDVPRALDYYRNIPQGNDSYDHFIRFLLCSGFEYLKILNNNRSVFSRIKVKLPGLFIKTLLARVSSQTREEFMRYCEQTAAGECDSPTSI